MMMFIDLEIDKTVKMSQEVTKVAYGTGCELGQKQVE